jgi:hypothetical protein
MDFNTIKEFPVVIYGNLEKFNDTISKARVRIFYKGANRNGTYITDDFAKKLINSLPYSPVKGIYDEENQDFKDHGKARTEGRAYGVVANPPNFSWENHLDNDNVEREYACADVLLWTGLYKEAEQIPGKAQSMELYEPSILGEWKMIEGRKCFQFTEGCFLGLQALGDGVEPCFEGSQFFSLYTSLKDMVEQINKFQLDLTKGGKSDMPNNTFKLSDDQKSSAIFSLLNPNFNEAGGWILNYGLCDVYDQYAVCYNVQLKQYERVEYTKDDKEDSVTLGKKKKCFILDVSENEKAVLEAYQSLNGNFEKVNDMAQELSTLKEKNIENETKIGELNTSLSTLKTEKETSEANYTAAQATINSLNSELDGLKEFKTKTESQEKEEVITRYSELLDETILNPYKEKIADYTVDNLEKELAFELVKTNPTVFTKNPQYVPKDDQKGGIEDILSKYKK